MRTRLIFVMSLLFILNHGSVSSQTFHEIGGFVGPVALYSDYGQRNDFETNIGNTGIGLGLVHYLDFSYGPRNSFNQHFKVRSEFNFHTTSLQHYGEWVDSKRTSVGADQLRAMKGSSTVLEFGTHLEYYPRDLRDFNYSDYKLAPFASFGVHLVLYNPKVSSSMGPINTPASTPDKYINAFKQGMGTTFAVVGALGTRYKLNDMNDLVLMARWHYYFSDWIDGLNPREEFNKVRPVPENQSNDWLFWLSIGYIHYLD